MSWTVTLWGQPPSINHMYQVVWREDSRGRKYRGRAKSEAAALYQGWAKVQLQASKPSGWRADGQVQITYDLYLARDIDCDNLMKTVHDAFQQATGINDAKVLPCVRSKITGVKPREARIELTIAALPWPSSVLEP